MKELHLFEAVGLVDDRLVEEAADARRSVTPWKKWLPVAACMALVVGLGIAGAGTMLRSCGSARSDRGASVAAETAAPAAEEASPMPPMSAPVCEAPAADVPAGEAGGAWGAPFDEAAEEAPAEDAMPAQSAVPTEKPAPAADAEPETAVTGAADSVCDMDKQETGRAGSIPGLVVADGSGLTLRRALTLEADGVTGLVIDRYTVANPTDRAVRAAFSCLPADDPEEWEAMDFTALVDGVPQVLTVDFPDGDAEHAAPAVRAAFGAMIPPRGTVEIELRYRKSSGSFALTPASGGGLRITDQTFGLELARGAALARTDLPGDPTRELVELSPGADYTLTVKAEQ